MKIYAAITSVMKEVDHIGKDRKNAAQGYSFRGVDDVYAALQLVMAKHGGFTVPEVLEDRSEERTTGRGAVLIYRILKIKFRFYADDGSFVEATVIGEGMDSGDKASNKAMSVAHKYALLQVFMIPTSEAKDPENDDHDVAPKGSKLPPAPPAPPAPEKKAADVMAKKLVAMTKSFADVGVPQLEVEEFVGKKLADFTDDDLSKLKPLLAEIKEERATQSAGKV